MLKRISFIIEKIVNVLIFIIVLAIIFCLYNIFSLKVLGNEYVNIFGYTFFEVATGSMSGSIEVSDAVIVSIDEEYSVGDVITYKSGSDFITHRVIEEYDDYIVTKGDANSSADNPIDKSMVLGKVVHIFRGVGVWKDVLLTPKVILLIFATLFVFSVLFAYNGKNIKIVIANDGTDDNKNENIKEEENASNDILNNKEDIGEQAKKKTLEYTQVININDLKKDLKKKKVLEYTQVINLKDLCGDIKNEKDK